LTTYVTIENFQRVLIIKV